MEQEKRLKSYKYLLILAIILMIVVGFLLFRTFYVKTCPDISCFNLNLEKCKKISFINEAEDASWLYTINGGKGSLSCLFSNNKCESCKINVKLLQVKKGTSDVKAIEGLNMDCSLAYGYVGIPNSDLGNCHGLLKEELQALMIKKMHSYILSNVGKIGEELNKGI